ncbi:6420_t:CDS:2, partial [Dentiscutata heterogama]
KKWLSRNHVPKKSNCYRFGYNQGENVSLKDLQIFLYNLEGDKIQCLNNDILSYIKKNLFGLRLNRLISYFNMVNMKLILGIVELILGIVEFVVTIV